MRRYFQQGRGQLVIGWLLALLATTVYLLTLSPTVSFWDCGEFITTNYQLSIGHPPGAPLYQLLAHAFTWLAGSNTSLVAFFSNALSAVAGGLTIMFLYWILMLLFPQPLSLKSHLAAVVGALCYLFCDTAWFSAVESEVYALAVLFVAMTLWSMLRWFRCDNPANASRWLLLTAFLLGLGVCVHLLTLLVAPALLLLLIFGLRKWGLKSFRASSLVIRLLSLVFFFFLGLTPYCIIPIRAEANPPINFVGPATQENVKRYLSREQYEHAPLYPRIWRHHPHDQEYASDWSGGDNSSFVGNMRFFATYQVGYMYFRYLMWNFAGRYNDYRGYGSLQNGQFITGIPPIDRLLVGTGVRPPDSLSHGTRHVYFLLPLLLGLLGLGFHANTNRRGFWVMMTLFLVSGLGLSIYLNHPTYEPRERDYAYVLSFFAFACWIGWGALYLLRLVARWSHRCSSKVARALLLLTSLLLLSVPSLMAAQNWSSHDRSHNFVARESALNLLNSCDDNAILFTFGDNDTFPLWYAQQVEQVRTDVNVYNINLIGYSRFAKMLDTIDSRPVFFSHFAYGELASFFPNRLIPQAMAFRMMSDSCTSDALASSAFRKVMHELAWTPVDDRLDEVSYRFVATYWDDMLSLANNLVVAGNPQQALQVLDKTAAEVPPSVVRDPRQLLDISTAYATAGNEAAATSICTQLHSQLDEQLRYYHTMPTHYQRIISYSVLPREHILDSFQGDF